MNLLVLIDQLEILIEQATEVPLIGKFCWTAMNCLNWWM